VFGIAAIVGIAIVIAASIPQQEQEPAGRNLEVKIEDAASSKSTPDERLDTEPLQQQVPAPGFEDVPEMIVESENNCDPSYPDVCIQPYPPDLDCGEIRYTNFYVLQPDPHGFDPDKDGIGCES